MSITGIKEDIQTVLKEYDIDVIGIKTESYKGKKGVWWIGTPAGQKILKKEAYSCKTLEFIIAAMEHLMCNGISLKPCPSFLKVKVILK